MEQRIMHSNTHNSQTSLQFMTPAITAFPRMIICFLCLLLITILHAHAQPEKVAPLYEQTSEVNNIMVQYQADYGNLSRFYVIQNSPERRERLLATVNDYINKLSQLDFDKL